MNNAPIIVIGGGQAGFSACTALRDNGFDGRILLVCEERTLPYERPPLSKDYLKGEADVILRPASFYESKGIELIDDRVSGIDRSARCVVFGSGQAQAYHKVVLATGARARTLPVPGSRLANVFTLRTTGDADSLAKVIEPGCRVVIVGGGFIGLEVASFAQDRGCDTTVVEALPHTMARVVTPQTSSWIDEVHRSRGTHLLMGKKVTGFEANRVVLDGDERLDADIVVIGVGVVPNVELAYQAGLPTADGILVDENLRTSDPNIYAIGDCARFPTRFAGGLIRLESVQNAVDQGKCVAANITGQAAKYEAVPWFWTDQCGFKLQIVGISYGFDTAIVNGDPSEGKFSVFCFRTGELVAVESINRPADHMISRRMLAGTPDLTVEEVSAPEFDLKTRRKD